MLNYWDFVAYLRTLNYGPICYIVPYGDDKLKEGSRDRVVEYLRNNPYLVNLVSRIEEMEQMEGQPDKEEQYNEWKKRVSYSLFGIIQDGRHSYRKVLVLDGKEYRISPVTEQEFRMFHGGSIECFKKDFGYKELSDFTPEQLGMAELKIYQGNNGMPLSWSDWNCCIPLDEEAEKILHDACIKTNFLWEYPDKGWA
jgi:hypothetical protein